MAGFAIQLTLGDERFRLDGVTVQEVDKVTSITPYKNRREWFTGCEREEPKALIAAYIIAKARDGVEVRWADVNFDADIGAAFVDESGREVEPRLEKNDDGTVRTTDDGMPIPVLRDGSTVWVYSDTGEDVPPTEVESSTTSNTPTASGSDGAIESSTPIREPVSSTTS